MLTLVEMPKANENLTEATLDCWLVKPGERVNLDQPLCEIITDKAKFELPSPAAGTMLKMLAPERALLPVGYVLCVIGEPGEQYAEDLAVKNEALLNAHRQSATALSGSGKAPTPGAAISGSGVRATPAARRLAKELGVDLTAVAAALKLSGPVNEKDIRAFVERK